MNKRKAQHAARWTNLLATMKRYVEKYRPIEVSIPGVGKRLWIQLKKRKIVPVGICDMLQYDHTIQGVRQSPTLVQKNDMFALGAVQYHFTPKLVPFIIMDYLDDTSDRCTTCLGTIRLEQRTPCGWCGKSDRLIHTGCYVHHGKSLCVPCSKHRFWCDSCEIWFERTMDPRCYCDTIHRDCMSVSSSKSCGMCEKLHHLACFESDQRFCEDCLETGLTQCAQCDEFESVMQFEGICCAECGEHFHYDCMERYNLVCSPCYRAKRPPCIEYEA